MGDLFWLTDEQIERLRPFFPKSRGKRRVDDRCPNAFFSAVALAATIIVWL